MFNPFYFYFNLSLFTKKKEEEIALEHEEYARETTTLKVFEI